MPVAAPPQQSLPSQTRMPTNSPPKYTAPFDTKVYSIHPDMAEVFKKWTGIVDDDELKEHLIKVSKEAFDHFRYPCISMFPPTDLPSYDQIKALGRHRKRHILLEIGPGLGTEIRRLVYDGYPVNDIVAIDLLGGLWESGHALFKSDASTFPVKFIEGDIFRNEVLSLDVPGEISQDNPRLEEIENLEPLSGKTSVIIIQQVFHLFSLERQIELAKRLLKLIKLEKGSIICGRQGGSVPERNCHTQNVDHYLHSPKTWEKMWEELLPTSKAKYSTEFRPLPADIEEVYYSLSQTTGYVTWSIEIL
ncbi:hypothetical protein Clacol_009974 [Clathrus columnatus]|uniref:Methyltransferase type 11 domain-containing protein n=1 Tax=Clathrus columnatus TaxID=1419009 RepID=A0AAV5ATP8_9AGAM|nr:hypothetical protein Clacol_009974 [Clathrus columnatus]